MTDVKEAVKAYLAEIGRKGGAAGTGSKKRRSPEHYRKMGLARMAKAKRKKKGEKAEKASD